MENEFRRKGIDRKQKDKSRWSKIAKGCLAVGTVVKIVWDWNLPIEISFPFLLIIMFASLFGIARDIIVITILLFFTFTSTILSSTIGNATN